MTRRALLVFALAGGVAAMAASLSQQEQNALTAIDTLATENQLDSAFGGSATALPSLAAIAGDPGGDPGIRLRAIHALTFYCPLRDDGTGQIVPDCLPGDPAFDTLVANVLAAAMSGARDGVDLLVLRASLASLGKVGAHVPVADPGYGLTATVAGFLSHGSRDVRATAARALGDLGDCQAVTPLRVRYQEEPFDQVRLAISAALRTLARCP